MGPGWGPIWHREVEHFSTVSGWKGQKLIGSRAAFGVTPCNFGVTHFGLSRRTVRRR